MCVFRQGILGTYASGAKDKLVRAPCKIHICRRRRLTIARKFLIILHINFQGGAFVRATIKMIAERAGVSIGTVDRVLHNRPYVKAEVRERVLAVMAELDYRPNRMASALATSGTARHLAVIQPEWGPYIQDAMADGVSRFMEERRDYNVSVEVLCYPHGDPEGCLRLLEQVGREQVHGVALCGSDCGEIHSRLEELSSLRIPVVTFNSDIPQAPRLCYVGEDAHHAGRVAGEIASKFLRPGDKVLLAYSGLEYVGHKGRADGFFQRLEERGVPRESFLVAATHDDYEKTLEAVTCALAAEPDLRYIYLATQSVPGCVEALRRAGRTGQVRVLAHDNSPEIRRFLKEGLVDFSIDQNLPYQSYQALSILFGTVMERREPERDCYYPSSAILNAETAE